MAIETPVFLSSSNPQSMPSVMVLGAEAETLSCTPPPLSFLCSSCAHHGFKAQARLLFLQEAHRSQQPREFSGLVWPVLHVNSLFPSLLLDVKVLFSIISSPLPTQACAQRDAPEVLKCTIILGFLLRWLFSYGCWHLVLSVERRNQRTA